MSRRKAIPARVRHLVDRRAWRTERQPCQLKLPGICTFERPFARHWTEYHHRRMKSRGGPDTAGNLVKLCDRCHQWIHYPGGPTRWAIRAGLLLLASPGNRMWRREVVQAAGLLDRAVVEAATLARRHH